MNSTIDGVAPSDELAAWHAEADRLKKCVDYAPTGMDAHNFRLQLAAHLHTKPASGVKEDGNG